MARATKAKRAAPPQIVVRVTAELDESLREAAAGLGLDISGVVRMILTEHVPEYIERGRAAEQRRRAARAKGKKGPHPTDEPVRRNLDLSGTPTP